MPSWSPISSLLWTPPEMRDSDGGWGAGPGGAGKADGTQSQCRAHACPGGRQEAIRAGRWGRAGRRASGQAHHTEHLWAGFMGESLGQWKARPNSSNWDTLPRTLQWEERPAKCGSQHTPAVPSHPHMLPPRFREGVRPRQASGHTCSAQVRACRSALAGRWTATAA